MTTDAMRRVAEKREVLFHLKLTTQEAEDLRWLAERKFRRPGDEVRWLINEAVRQERVAEGTR
jgi:hypothetical protein